MKKLLFGIIATVLFSFTGNAQVASRVKLICYTASCCSVGPFGIEIWSETTCYYGSNKGSIKFNQVVKDKEIVVNDEMILAGVIDENGDNLVLPKGKYAVVDNGINFTPVPLASGRRYCIERAVDGNFLGHEYSYSVSICVSFRNASNNGMISIFPKLTANEIASVIKDNKGEILFNKDIVVNSNGLNFVLKAGKYKLNEDGGIYVAHVKIK